MAISYNGYDANCITILKDNNNNNYSGTVVLNEYGRVTRPTNGSEIYLVAVADRCECVTAQTRGYVELKYSGTAPGCGMVKLGCDTSGGVCVSSSASAHLVLKVDTVNKIVGFII